MMNNHRPLSTRKTLRLLIGLTILVWATQTLLTQWGYGQIVQESFVPEEQFVPGTERFARGATLELRSEARVVGGEVRLRQVCRWAQADDVVFEPIGNLVLTHLGANTAYQSITLEQIKRTLHDAGINLAAIHFRGPLACTVERRDVPFDEQAALRQWAAAKLGNAVAESESAMPAAAQPADWSSETDETQLSPHRSLRQLLSADLAGRLGVDPQALQVDFRIQDEKVLNLAEPHFQFEVQSQRTGSLGDVSWNVMIFSGEQSERVHVSAKARAWEQQLVVTKPLAARQVIREEDIAVRRTLVDRLTDGALTSAQQVVGQQTSRDLSPGSILTGRLVEAQQMVRSGQYVSVKLVQGGVQVRTVVRAMEAGAYGQSIRVRNESTREIFRVTVTGPQEATMSSVGTDLASLPTD